MFRDTIYELDEILKLSEDNKRFSRLKLVIRFLKVFILEQLANISPTNSIRMVFYRMMGLNIGKDVYIGNYVIFDRIFPKKIFIGDHTSIGDRCIITAHANIPTKSPLRVIYPRSVKETFIGKGVWIMPGCIIIPGVRIGDYAVIATGSVVTKDVPSCCLAGGVPAKILKKIDIHDVQEK